MLFCMHFVYSNLKGTLFVVQTGSMNEKNQKTLSKDKIDMDWFAAVLKRLESSSEDNTDNKKSKKVEATEEFFSTLNSDSVRLITIDSFRCYPGGNAFKSICYLKNASGCVASTSTTEVMEVLDKAIYEVLRAASILGNKDRKPLKKIAPETSVR